MIDFSSDINAQADKAALLAYNKVIVEGAKMNLYKSYGIALFEVTSTGQARVSKGKSDAQLNEELVNAIAIEKAKPILKEIK